MSNWYYYNEHKEKIAVTGRELKQLALSGAITPETFVETHDGKTGFAKHVTGLKFPIPIVPIPVSAPVPETQTNVMENWYYHNESGEKIATTIKELKQLLEQGVITLKTFVETHDGHIGHVKLMKPLDGQYSDYDNDWTIGFIESNKNTSNKDTVGCLIGLIAVGLILPIVLIFMFYSNNFFDLKNWILPGLVALIIGIVIFLESFFEYKKNKEPFFGEGKTVVGLVLILSGVLIWSFLVLSWLGFDPFNLTHWLYPCIMIIIGSIAATFEKITEAINNRKLTKENAYKSTLSELQKNPSNLELREKVRVLGEVAGRSEQEIANDLTILLVGLGGDGEKINVTEEIKKLSVLHTTGVITQEEFERGKSLFLGSPPDKAQKTMEAITSLHQLMKQGAISEGEFNIKKWDLLAGKLIK